MAIQPTADDVGSSVLIDVGVEVEREGLLTAAALFHSLSDPARLSILRRLTLGEHRVIDLTAHLGLAQSTVSKHLSCLRECGLVTSRAVGRASLYSLAVGDELNGLLTVAERLLAATGRAVQACPTYGTPETVYRRGRPR